MTTIQRVLLFGGGAVLIVGVVILVLFLRQRTMTTLSDDLQLGAPASSVGSSRNAEFTATEIKRRDETKRLQEELPKDIRETWTPEFRKQMETPNK